MMATVVTVKPDKLSVLRGESQALYNTIKNWLTARAYIYSKLLKIIAYQA